MSIAIYVMQGRVVAGIAAGARETWCTLYQGGHICSSDSVAHLVLFRPSPPQRSDLDMASL